MGENKSRSDSQEMSAEALEAIFSGPSLADSIDTESDHEELTRFAQKFLSEFEASSEASVVASQNPQALSEAVEDKVVQSRKSELQKDKFTLSNAVEGKPLGESLGAQLNLMASSASDIASRRTARNEYEASTFAAVAEKKAEIQAISETQSCAEESPVLDPNSPEALRERIKAYQERPKEKNLMAQSLGIVFSFGFTVAAVILAFWWFGQRAVEYSGRTWLSYPFIIFGVLLGLYSGALVLKPFLKGALPVIPSSKNKQKSDDTPSTDSKTADEKVASIDESEENNL